MPETTPIEGLPYPCLGDPFERQSIEDLALAADLTLNRIRSDVNLIDRRARGQMQLVGSQVVTQNVYTFLNTSQIDYDIRTGATTGTPGFFVPDYPGLYFCTLEMAWTASANITKVNPEVVTTDAAGVNLAAQFGRSLNQNHAANFPRMRVSGLAHLANSNHQIRARVRHQGTVTMTVGSVVLTTQYLGGCRNQLLANPYFERGITDWVADSANTTLAHSSAQAYRGNYSMSIAGGPAVTDPRARSSRFAVVAGRVYHCIGWLYTTVSENFNVGFRWFDAAGVSTGVNFSGTIASIANGWKRYAITATAPALTVSSEIRIARITATTPPPVYYADDVEVFEFC